MTSKQHLPAMSKILILIAFIAILALESFSQRPTMELTFTAVDNAAYVQLDSIKIMNRTQGGDTVLYWPDTVLSFDYASVPEISGQRNTFKLFQNYPNPVADQTTISLYVPEKGKVSIMVTDILGRVILGSERMLEKGKHSFQFTAGSSNLYFFTARWQQCTSSIKILNLSSGSAICLLDYIGGEPSTRQLKSIADIQAFSFNPGDELLYIGYANGPESGLLDHPVESTLYTFQFATHIPCPGTPMVEYEGQVYNTIQIFSQCWLKENLNVGVMISGIQNMTDNDTIEKYCYNNEPDSCFKYGGLYQWNEMMQYTTQQGVQGICPPGWHLPTDEEWKVLEGGVDSQYGIGDPEWESYLFGSRGYDAGTNLKTTSGWNNNGNGTDPFGYSGLPGGIRDMQLGGAFVAVGEYGNFFTSTEYSYLDAWQRYLSDAVPTVGRPRWEFDIGLKKFGLSVRCLRDD